jgi:hypothetical protein
MTAHGVPIGIICGVVNNGVREVWMGPFGFPDPDIPIGILQLVCETVLEDYRRTRALPERILLRFADDN